MTPLVLAFALALQAQYVPPPYTPYVQPSPYAPQAYPRSTLPSWAPPTLPPGSPGIMIPMPGDPPPPPAPWRSR
jgi:hypothetical protein